jgi:hypothetical protein
MYKKYTRNFHRQIREEIVSLWIQIKCADFIVNLSLLYIIISSQLYMNFVLELKKNWTKGTIGLTVECSSIYTRVGQRKQFDYMLANLKHVVPAQGSVIPCYAYGNFGD